MNDVNLWDFDNTIYDGESVFDFFLFCLRKKWRLIRFFPVIAYSLVMYKLGLMSIERLMRAAGKITSAFTKYQTDFDGLAVEFWKVNEKKLKPMMQARLNEGDLITTGSPDFIMNAVLSKLKVRGAICSVFDTKTGELLFANFGENKVISLRRHYPNVKIVNFYTDSKADTPLMNLATNVFLVKGNKIIRQ